MIMIMGIIVLVVISLAACYAILVSMGYDNFNGITLQLDKMYKNTEEMVYAVFEELVKQGKECEIIETGKGYPKFIINGKKYVMIHKMYSMRGFPVQTIQLKICKE